MASDLIKGLIQVCIVSEDLDSTVRSLAEKFGIGPWKCWDYQPPRLLQTTRSGLPSDWTLKLAVAWIGAVQLEVIQPTGGPTVYREYIDTNGEGIQHLMVDTKPGFSDAIRAFESAGYAVIQGARINPPMLVGGITLPSLPGPVAARFATRFVYHDTEADLGTVIELARMPPGISFRLGVKLGKADYTVPPAKLPAAIREIRRVGIIVEDLDAAIRHWEAVGVGPWTDQADPEARIATANLAPVSLELVQPSGDSVYRTLLDTHGPGVRYLGISGLDKEDFEVHACPVMAETTRGAFIDGRSAAHTVFLV